MHPDTELQFVGHPIGYGVIATRFIPKGTITWVRDRLDQRLSLEEVERLPAPYRDIVSKYTFLDGKGNFVLCWDLARYMNHSCEPSCRSPGYDFELAVRDVLPGQELTDDYGSLNLEYDFECSCGTPSCRRGIQPGDLLRYGEAWDREIEEPFRLIPTVAQPLWVFLEDPGPVEAALAGLTPIASCLEHYCDLEELYKRRSLL